MIDPNALNLNGLEQQYGLPNGLLTAVMQQESGGNPNAVSKTGAQGLFQFMPATAAQYGIDPTDPQQAAQGAARMYGDLSKKYNGDLPSMLAAYNWGQGNVDRHGLQNAPEETRNYISSITGKLGTQVADSGQTMTDALPPIPEGFQLQNQELPPIPEGFVLDKQENQATKEAGVNEGKSVGRTVLDQGLQGATFGFSDEVTNPLGATVAALTENPLGTLKAIFTGQTPEVSDALNEEIAGVKDTSKKRLEAQMREHPLVSLASNVGGALVSGGAGAGTKAGLAIADFLGSGNTLARIAKGALAGAASGGLYGAGTADEGSRLQGAKQGAVSGAVVGGAIPAAGAALSDVSGTLSNVAKGAFAKSPEAVQDIASSLKSSAGAVYDKMRQAGADFTSSAAQRLITDLKSSLASQDFLPSLNPKTLGVVNDLDNIIAQAATGGNLKLSTLDQIRRQLGRIGATEDGVSAGRIKNVIDDFVNKATGADLTNGSRAAIDLLNQGRKQYALASKYEHISDILTNAAGDPNKIKAGLTRFLNSHNGKPPGYTTSEIAALKAAASSGTTEKLLKMAGKFGIDLGTSLTPGNTVAPVIGALASGGGTVPVAATVARQAQKYAARGKADALLKVIQNGGGSNKAANTALYPALSALGGGVLPNYQSVPAISYLKSFAGVRP